MLSIDCFFHPLERSLGKLERKALINTFAWRKPLVNPSVKEQVSKVLCQKRSIPQIPINSVEEAGT